MPRKRSEAEKAANRERMALKRSRMSKDEIKRERQLAKERMANRNKQMSPESKAKQRSLNKERMAAKRAKDKAALEEYRKANPDKKKESYGPAVFAHEREFNRNYKRNLRSKMTAAEHEYEKIYNLLCMRKKREKQTGKEHLLSNLKAKKGMRLIDEKGYLMPFQERSKRETDEVELWFAYCVRSVENEDVLREKNPLMASKVDEIVAEELKKRDERRKKRDQEEKEREEKERERRKEGYWDYNVVMDMYEWVGDNPPSPGNINPDEREQTPPLYAYKSEEEYRELLRQSDEQEREWERQERNAYARKRYHMRKKLLKTPIELPDIGEELSEYEKIREMNIKLRNEMMKEAAKEKGFEFNFL